MMNLKYKNQIVEEVKDANSWVYDDIKENNAFIPVGLETKINIYWFQYFFKRKSRWDKERKEDEFFVKEFSGDWLDVPYPHAKKIYIESLRNIGEVHQSDLNRWKREKRWFVKEDNNEVYVFEKFERELKDDFYNWYELVQYMNDLLIEDGRLVDLGLTNIECVEGEIRIGYST